MVVSDDPLVRAGLAALLADEAGLDVVGSGPATALDWNDVDVAVWDATAAAFELPSSTDLRAVPAVAVLRDESQAGLALAAGARAVLARDASAARLGAAVRAVAEGLVVLDAGAADDLLRPPAASAPPPEPLTPRELEVLQLLAEGLSNKLVAARLAISEHTAKFHVNSILGKLGAQTRAEAVALAARHGLLLL